MGTTVARIGLALAAASAAPLAAQSATVVETGPHVAVQLHCGALTEPLGRRLAAAALAAAEGTWPTVERLLLLRPGKPATIELHADEAAFRAIEKTATSASRFRELVVHLDRQEAHVLLWPQLLPRDLEIVGLPAPTRDLVVRAAAQLFAAQKSTAVLVDPWLAEVFAYAVLEGKQAQSPKYGVDAVFDSRRWNHEGAGEKPTLRRWVTEAARSATRAELEIAEEGKCLAAQLLAGCGADWARRFLANPLRPGDSARVVREAAVERLLGTDWQKNEARWQKQLAAIRVPFYVRSPMVAPAGRRLLLLGSPDQAATLNGAAALPQGPFRICATCELVAPEEDGLRLQLDWDEQSLLGVFLRPGAVRLSQWEPGKPWAVLDEGKAAIANGRPFDVVAEVDAERGVLTVAIDGTVALRWPYGARGMRGLWSLAKNEIPAYVEGLRVEAGKPK